MVLLYCMLSRHKLFWCLLLTELVYKLTVLRSFQWVFCLAYRSMIVVLHCWEISSVLKYSINKCVTWLFCVLAALFRANSVHFLQRLGQPTHHTTCFFYYVIIHVIIHGCCIALFKECPYLLDSFVLKCPCGQLYPFGLWCPLCERSLMPMKSRV